MKSLLNEVVEGRRLSRAESGEVLRAIVAGDFNSHQVAAILAVIRYRGFTLDELDGFREAVLQLGVRVDLGYENLIDVCGTGGDHKNTFNISTTVAFVLAGAGYKVAKHGNYAVSSQCGSSNVLEALGIKFFDDPAELRKSLEISGVCFMHAPIFHPALKSVREVRSALGIRTIFNALGPLVSPASPHFQLIGVYNLELLRLYGYLMQRHHKRFAALFSTDGYDEVSLTSPIRVVSHKGEYLLSADDFGLRKVLPSEIEAGKTVGESAAIIEAILSGDGTRSQESVVIANAALAMWCDSKEGSLKDFTVKAAESLRSRAAFETLKNIRELHAK